MIGQTISHYRILEKLGVGGMGVVYKAEDMKLGRFVALKFLPDEVAKDPQALARFQREAQAASALNHPNIITIYESDSYNGVAFIAMEYVRGHSLVELMRDRGLADAETLSYALQIAEALTKAHQAGIVHRDLKPSNVMITQDGLVKVLDFGLAKVGAVARHADTGAGGPTSATETQALLSMPGTTIGTLSYMSPEQARGEPVDARSDLFSFGIMSFEMLTRTLPFAGDNLLAVLHNLHFEAPKDIHYLRPNLAPEVAAVVGRCLQKMPGDRYQSAAEISRDLRAAQGSDVAFRTSKWLPGAVEGGALSPLVAPLQDVPSLDAHRAPRKWKLAVSLSLLAVIASAAAVPSVRHGVSDLLARFLPASHRAAETAPDTPFYLQRQAQTYLERWDVPDNLDRSITLLNHAIELDHDYAPAYASLTFAYFEKDQLNADSQWVKQATQSAARALQLNSDLAEAHLATGVADMLSGKNREAESEFRKASELDPKNSKPHRWLGFMLIRGGNSKQAEEELKRALAMDSSDWRANMDLGLLYYKTDRFPQAASAWERVSKLTPDNFIVLYNLAAAYHMLDRYEDAASVLQRSLEIKPSAYAYGNLGTLRFFQGRYDDAVPAFEKAVKMEANEYLWWGNLGDAYRWAPGQATKAKPAYQNAIRLIREEIATHPEDLELQTNLALYLAKSGDKHAALAQIKEADHAPDKTASVLFNSAVVHELGGERDQALAALSAAHKAGYALKEIKNEPELVALRADPRYQLLLSDSTSKN
jgi:eukaryotic-like serine/threonine-protein kinase